MSQHATNGQTETNTHKTIDRLIAGHLRFTSAELPAHRADFERLSKGQSPAAVFITCSDSRVQPHLITQASPGDLFVIRNAGNIVPPYEQPSSEGASLEYAVRVLEVPHIIVCGHSSCGAMGGLLRPDAVASLDKVRRWVDLSSKALQAVEKGSYENADARLSALVAENVLLQREHLMTYPFVAERVERGSLHLHSWVYDIGTGLIAEFDSGDCRFVALGKSRMAFA